MRKHWQNRRSRRKFVTMCASVVAAGAAVGCAKPEASSPSRTAQDTGRRDTGRSDTGGVLSELSGERYNTLFIVTNQERYLEEAPVSLPGRERRGTFVNHQNAAIDCSPSRSVIYTKQHIQNSGILDHIGTPWQQSLSEDVPTVGHMLLEADYYTAYKGKFHLSSSSSTSEPDGRLP